MWFLQAYFRGVRRDCGGDPRPGRHAHPAARAQSPAAGPLRRLESNPRYFTDGSGKAVLLVGSHNWGNFQDNGHRRAGGAGPAAGLRLRRLPRLPPEAQPQLLPPLAVGGAEVDRRAAGGDRQVLPAPSLDADRARARRPTASRSSTSTSFDPAYFDRMRERVAQAGDRGIYVSVMLFEGWEMQFTDAWKFHPFHGPEQRQRHRRRPRRPGAALQPAPRRRDGQEGPGLAGGLPAQGGRHGQRPGQRALRGLQRDRGLRAGLAVSRHRLRPRVRGGQAEAAPGGDDLHVSRRHQPPAHRQPGRLDLAQPRDARGGLQVPALRAVRRQGDRQRHRPPLGPHRAATASGSGRASSAG